MIFINKKNKNEDLDERKKQNRIDDESIQELKEEISSLQKDLIDLLKEKGKGFDQYLYYHDLCSQLKDGEKENRQKMADIKREETIFKNEISNYASSLLKIFPTISKIKSDKHLLLLLKTFSYAGKEIPIKSITDSCRKLGITKGKIEKYDLGLYEALKIEEWEIDE